MPQWIIAILTTAIFITIILLAHFYEKILIPSICFGCAIFFGYCAIASTVYLMLIIPAFCIVYGIINIKDNPIHRKK